LVVNGVHLAAMGIWTGGLIALLVLWRVSEHDMAVSRNVLLAGFSRIAAVSASLLVLTGSILAWEHLAAPANILNTTYGVVLAAKVVGVLIVLATAAIALRMMPGRRERGWAFEAAVLAGVLAIAGLLVSLPPPQ